MHSLGRALGPELEGACQFVWPEAQETASTRPNPCAQEAWPGFQGGEGTGRSGFRLE